MYVDSFLLIGGTLANYSIDLGSVNIAGNVFTSDSIVAGDPYRFVISDGSSCAPLDIEDTPDCGCSTNAGNLTAPGSTPVLFCENEMEFPLSKRQKLLRFTPILKGILAIFAFRVGINLLYTMIVEKPFLPPLRRSGKKLFTAVFSSKRLRSN